MRIGKIFLNKPEKTILSIHLSKSQNPLNNSCGVDIINILLKVSENFFHLK